MNNFITKMGEKKFRYLSALFCLLGDILLAIYILIIFTNFDKFQILFKQTLNLMGIQASHFSPDLIRAQFSMMKSSLGLMLAGFLFIHLIVYILHIAKKSSATNYIKMTLILTIPTSAYFIYEAWSISKIFSLLFLLQVPLYIFSYQGIKLFHQDPHHLKSKELKKYPDQLPPKLGGV